MGNGEQIIPRNAWWSIKDKVIDITYDYIFVSSVFTNVKSRTETRGAKRTRTLGHSELLH